MAAPAETRCPWHHGPVSACPPPLDPELGDLLPDLIQRGVDIRINTTNRPLVRCEACIEAGRAGSEPVATVCHLAPSEALPEGYTYRESTCVEHLWPVVTWELRRGCKTWIEIPAGAA